MIEILWKQIQRFVITQDDKQRNKKNVKARKNHPKCLHNANFIQHGWLNDHILDDFKKCLNVQGLYFKWKLGCLYIPNL